MNHQRTLISSCGALRAAALCIAASTASAAQGGSLPTGIAEARDLWRSLHGANWELVFNHITGKGRMLLGGDAFLYQPTSVAEEWQLARDFIADAYGMLEIEDSSLIEDRIITLPLAALGTTDKRTLRFQQAVDDVPIVGASVNVLFEAGSGQLLSIDSMALPGVMGLSIVPLVDDDDALLIAELAFDAETDSTPTTISDPVLVILPADPELEESETELAWQVDIEGLHATGLEPVFRFYVSAIDGDLLVSEDRVLDYAPQQAGQWGKGRVKSHTTENGTCLSSSGPCNTNPTCWRWFPVELEDHLNQPHMTVHSFTTGTQTVTNATGLFSLPIGPPTQDVVMQFLGPYIDVDDALGQDVARLEQIGPGPIELITMFPMESPRTDTEEEIAQANAFFRINQTRDWVRGVNANDTAMDSSSWTASVPYRAVVNRTVKPCTADYTGTAVRFSHSFSGPPPNIPPPLGKDPPPTASCWECPMTAYAPIIWHEMGHWLADRYSNGNGGTNRRFHGFGEGVADTFAMYQMDYHRLVYNIPVPPACPESPTVNRCGNNLEQACGNCESDQGCIAPGGHHQNGLPLMGAFWRMRHHMKMQFPSIGAALSNALFLGWLNAYDTNRVHTIIEYQLLVLDDNDRNLGNGTPHLGPIDQAFNVERSFDEPFSATVFSTPANLSLVICP